MWTVKWMVAGAGLILIIAAVTSSAFALGAQWHQVNSIAHGCVGSDYGCEGPTNFAGDYHRQGWTTGVNVTDMLWVNIVHPSCNQGQCSYGLVWDSTAVSANYDTNPIRECEFITRHQASGPNLQLHNHYTESASSPTHPTC